VEVPIAPGLGLYLDEVYFENYNINQAKLAVLHDEKIASNAAAKAAIVTPNLDDDAVASTDGTAAVATAVETVAAAVATAVETVAAAVVVADADNETEPVCL
jgi:hypothetical protein